MSSLEYYQACEGKWQGSFPFRVVHLSLLVRRPLGLLNKVRVLLFWISALVMGAPTLHTEVEVSVDDDLVKHRTRITHWGLLLYRAEENFHLQPDGESLIIDGRESLFPMLWNYRALPPATGRVEPSGMRAHYEWNWFGEKWIMINTRFEGGVTSELSCDWAQVGFRLESAH